MIQLSNITKQYVVGDSLIHALRDVNIRIDHGEYVAITGHSGSGKSTLMNILGCLDKPTGGTYTLNEVNVESLSDDELSGIRNKEIGFVFQTFNLFMRKDVYFNVSLPLVYAYHRNGVDRSRVLAMIEKVGLMNRLHHKPNELSGGQRQRVAIARALVTGPSLILADEPTGNLDSATSRDIMKIFDSLHEEGVTVIIVTHEADIAAHCKRTIHITDGSVADQKKVKRLRS
ncbi:MAG: ABC transporter ATP-binding protein [Spirochaetes bacterium]|nr:ABC transporter ATP-binding protein [Spirochaetota bacterium]